MPEGRAGSEQSLNPLRRAWRSLMDMVVQDVPNENEACEFECRTLECTFGEWKTCESRLRTAARRRIPPGPPKGLGDE